MARLLLLRHARAGWAEPGMRDFDRRLDATGTADAEALGKAMRAGGLVPDRVLCSSARRARQTWEGVCSGLAFAGAATMTETLYSTDAAGYLNLIREAGNVASLLLVGHNPMIEDLAFALVGEEQARALLGQGFPTAGLAVIAFDGPWAAIAPGAGRLDTFVTPADL